MTLEGYLRYTVLGMNMLLTSLAAASPTIGKIVVASVTSTTATITWVTDVPSDSMVVYGLDDGYGSTGPVDPTPVTAHSITLTGLWPGQTYYFGVRSANRQGATWAFPDPFAAKPPDPNASYDFYFRPEGPNHVVQGSPIYVQLHMGLIGGKRQRVQVRVTGLPDRSVLHFPDMEDRSICCAFDAKSGTASLYEPGRTQFAVATSKSTAPGRYTLRLRVASGSVTKEANYVVIVDPLRELPRGKVTSYPRIPELRRWQDGMKDSGAKWCVQQTSPGVKCGVGAENCSWYYDGERVYLQIAAYTRDPKWTKCADNSKVFYRDDYVMAANPPGAIQGWRVFPHGLFMDYRQTADPKSKAAVQALAEKSAYADLQGLISTRLCREDAYKISANRLALDLGAGTLQKERLARSVDYALGHIDQWFVSRTAPWTQPFMVGLTMEALIQYYEDGHTNDSRIPVAIQTAADALWTAYWQKNRGSFVYNSFQTAHGMSTTSNYADLNLLIAPAYAWLWRYTGDPKYLAQGDEIFSQGVRQAAVDWNGKIFSQNYRWSFDYVRWRTAPSTNAAQQGHRTEGYSDRLGQ